MSLFLAEDLVGRYQALTQAFEKGSYYRLIRRVYGGGGGVPLTVVHYPLSMGPCPNFKSLWVIISHWPINYTSMGA